MGVRWAERGNSFEFLTNENEFVYFDENNSNKICSYQLKNHKHSGLRIREPMRTAAQKSGKLAFEIVFLYWSQQMTKIWLIDCSFPRTSLAEWISLVFYGNLINLAHISSSFFKHEFCLFKVHRVFVGNIFIWVFFRQIEVFFLRICNMIINLSCRRDDIFRRYFGTKFVMMFR